MTLVTSSSRDGIALITLHRAKKCNALNNEMFAGIGDALRAFEAGPGRVAVLCAEGKHFCAGVDLADPPRDMWKGEPG